MLGCASSLCLVCVIHKITVLRQVPYCTTLWMIMSNRQVLKMYACRFALYFYLYTSERFSEPLFRLSVEYGPSEGL